MVQRVEFVFAYIRFEAMYLWLYSIIILEL